jgi:hypothetical protein
MEICSMMIVSPVLPVMNGAVGTKLGVSGWDGTTYLVA